MSAWTRNRNQICLNALEICGADNNGSPSQININRANTCLHRTLTDLYNDGFIMNETERVTLNTQATSEVTGYRCIQSHTASATNQPGVGASWTDYWYPDANIVGAAWVSGTNYTSSGDIAIGTDTLDVIACYVRQNGDDTPLEIIDYDQYLNVPRKSQQGFPIMVYPVYQATIPRLYFYYQPDQTYQISYMRVKEISALSAPTDQVNFKSSLFNTIIENTAWHLSDILQKPLKERVYLGQKALQSKKLALHNEYKHEDDRICSGSFNYGSY